ncbi:hypothetical protein JC525_06020 [Alteromonas sp. IB21]|nr:hypothetical protein [Alteromonas sp. IB21]
MKFSVCVSMVKSTPMSTKTYPLTEIVTAQKEFSEKKHVGKIVLLTPPQTKAQQSYIAKLSR